MGDFANLICVETQHYCEVMQTRSSGNDVAIVKNNYMLAQFMEWCDSNDYTIKVVYDSVIADVYTESKEFNGVTWIDGVCVLND